MYIVEHVSRMAAGGSVIPEAATTTRFGSLSWQRALETYGVLAVFATGGAWQEETR